MAYNPALEQLRKQAEQRRQAQYAAKQESYKMRTIFDPIFNTKGREKAGGLFQAYAQYFDNNYIEWFRNPANALINNLTAMGDTMDIVANLVKAPAIALAKGENVGERLADAYGFGDNGRIQQNMSELREAVGATPSGIVGGIGTGALIGANFGWIGAAIGAAAGLVVGGASGLIGDNFKNAHIANTITDFTLEFIADPLNIISGISAATKVKDIAKVGKLASGAVDLTQEQIEVALKNAKGAMSKFLADPSAGTSAQASLNYVTTAMAEKAVKNPNIKNTSKFFKGFRNRFISSYFEDDFKAFEKCILDLGLADDVGGLTPAHRKIMFDILKKDAGMSRGTKVLGALSKVDDAIAKFAWLSTPVGMVGKTAMHITSNVTDGLSKVVGDAVESAKFKRKMDSIEKAINQLSSEQKPDDNVFKLFEERGIRFKIEKDMSNEDIVALYKEMAQNASKLEQEGLIKESSILRGMAHRLQLSDGVHNGSIKGLRSELNKVVRLTVLKHKGDFEKAISDPDIMKAYDSITNLLYFDVGEEAFLDYLVGMSYNKHLYEAIKDMDSIKALMKGISSTNSGGAHIIISEIMTRIAQKQIAEHPDSVYIKLIDKLSNEIKSEAKGIKSAYKAINSAQVRLQKSIHDKYLKVKDSLSVQKQFEYNKAILDVEGRDLSLSLKEYLEPKDYAKLYQARHYYKQYTIKRKAAMNLQLREFTEIARASLGQEKLPNAIPPRSISKYTEEANSIIHKLQIKAAAGVNISEGSGDIDDELLSKCISLAEGIIQDETIAINSGSFESLSSFNKTAARIYKTAKSLRKDYPNTDVFRQKLEGVLEGYKKQLVFKLKYNNKISSFKTALFYLQSSKDLSELDKAIRSPKIKPENQSKVAELVFKFLLADSQEEIAELSKSIPENVIIKCQNFLNANNIDSRFKQAYRELVGLSNSNLTSSVKSISSKFAYVSKALDSAVDINQPYGFNLVYDRAMSVIKEEFKGDKASVSNAAKLFKDFFGINSLDQGIQQNLLDTFEEYRRLGAEIVNYYNGDTTEDLLVKQYNSFKEMYDNKIREDVEIYTNYIYAKQCVNKSILNFDSAFSSHIEDVKKVISSVDTNTTEGALTKKIVHSKFAKQLCESASNYLNKRFAQVQRALEREAIALRFTNAEDVKTAVINIAKTHVITSFFYDIPTVLKAFEALKYISEGDILTLIKSQEDIFKNNISILMNTMLEIRRGNIDPSAEELFKLYNNSFGAINKVNEEVSKSLTSPEYVVSTTKLNPKYALDTSNSHELLSKYSSKAKTSLQQFEFAEIDSKVFKLVSKDGTVKTIPSDLLDVALDKAMYADLETHLGFASDWKPKADDVIQLSITTDSGKFNGIVYDENYQNFGRDNLLSESYTKGEELGKYNKEGYIRFSSNKTNYESWVTEDGTEYTLFKNRQVLAEELAKYLEPYIINHNGKKYIYVIGQNSTEFDNPAILDLLKKYGGLDIEGIISEDSLYFINAARGLSQVQKLLVSQGHSGKMSELLDALQDMPNAKLEEVYNRLLNSTPPLVKELTGAAHDASYDIQMTREIVNAFHSALNELNPDDVTTVGKLRDFFHSFSNGLSTTEISNIDSEVNSIIKNIKAIMNVKLTDPYLQKQFSDAIDRFDKKKNLPSNAPENLARLEVFIDDILDFEQLVNRNLSGAQSYNQLSEHEISLLRTFFDSVYSLNSTLDKLKAVRHALAQGVYGDSLVYAQAGLHYTTDYIMYFYPGFRNSESFLELLNIFNGEDIGSAQTMLGEVLLQHRKEYNQEGYGHILSKVFPKLDTFYKYTKRIDRLYDFNNKMNVYLSEKLNSVLAEEAHIYKEAYSRILDKLWGRGARENTRSLDSWFRLRLSDFDFSDEISVVKSELKNLIIAEGKLNIQNFMSDVQEDLDLIDNSGQMYKDILDYINDCIEHLEDYDIFTRLAHSDKNSATLLKPTPNSYYINNFVRAYQEVIGSYKDASGYTGIMVEEGEIRIKQLDAELDEMRKDMRIALSHIHEQNSFYKNIGPLPEGYIAESNGMNTWQINNSMQSIAFVHNKRSEDYYIDVNIRDKVYEELGIEFDPTAQTPPIKYRPEETNLMRTIRQFREASGLYINEIYELLNEFSFKDRPYVINKVRLYSDLFDELKGQVNPDEFVAYDNFVSNILDTSWGYLEENVQKDVVLRKQYEDYFKAVAANAYLSSSMGSSIDETLRTFRPSYADDPDLKNIINDYNYDFPNSKGYVYTNVSKSLKEYREQFVNLFKNIDGSYDYQAMFDYVRSNKDLEFVIFSKSNKYYKRDVDGKFIKDKTTGNYINAAELNIMPIGSPEQLKLALLDPKLGFGTNVGDFEFSIIDKHTIAEIKPRIGHQTANRRYKSKVLNGLVWARDKFMKYIVAPYKVLSLYNLGFSVTNFLEGAMKTFISTTGNRFDTLRQYGDVIPMFTKWVDLNTQIASATQGSPYFRMRDQLTLLNYENSIGRLIFANADDVLKGETPIIKDIKTFISDVQKNNHYDLPDYIVKDFYKKLRNNFFKEQYASEYAARFVKVNKLINNELPKYNLDDYKFVNKFINSPAAAAEFQSIKKASSLNLIGNSKEDNIFDRVFNNVMYSDKWLGGKHNPLSYVSPYANLSYNSNIEVINRLAMYKDLVEKGHIENEALNKVLAAHFNYGNKSQLETSLELLIPFISFPLRNFMYWNQALEEHPALLKHFVDLMICNWGDEKDNQYNQSKITKGGLRLWGDVSIESGISLFEAMYLGGNALKVAERKLSPFVSIPMEAAKQLTTGQSNLDYKLRRLPGVSHINNISNLAHNLSKGRVKLYDVAPSLFNEVYKQNRYYYNNQGSYTYKSAYNKLYYTSGKFKLTTGDRSKAIRYMR